MTEEFITFPLLVVCKMRMVAEIRRAYNMLHAAGNDRNNTKELDSKRLFSDHLQTFASNAIATRVTTIAFYKGG